MARGLNEVNASLNKIALSQNNFAKNIQNTFNEIQNFQNKVNQRDLEEGALKAQQELLNAYDENNYDEEGFNQLANSQKQSIYENNDLSKKVKRKLLLNLEEKSFGLRRKVKENIRIKKEKEAAKKEREAARLQALNDKIKANEMAANIDNAGKLAAARGENPLLAQKKAYQNYDKSGMSKEQRMIVESNFLISQRNNETDMIVAGIENQKKVKKSEAKINANRFTDMVDTELENIDKSIISGDLKFNSQEELLSNITSREDFENTLLEAGLSPLDEDYEIHMKTYDSSVNDLLSTYSLEKNEEKRENFNTLKSNQYNANYNKVINTLRSNGELTEENLESVNQEFLERVRNDETLSSDVRNKISTTISNKTNAERTSISSSNEKDFNTTLKSEYETNKNNTLENLRYDLENGGNVSSTIEELVNINEKLNISREESISEAKEIIGTHIEFGIENDLLRVIDDNISENPDNVEVYNKSIETIDNQLKAFNEQYIKTEELYSQPLSSVEGENPFVNKTINENKNIEGVSPKRNDEIFIKPEKIRSIRNKLLDKKLSLKEKKATISKKRNDYDKEVIDNSSKLIDDVIKGNKGLEQIEYTELDFERNVIKNVNNKEQVKEEFNRNIQTARRIDNTMKIFGSSERRLAIDNLNLPTSKKLDLLERHKKLESIKQKDPVDYLFKTNSTLPGLSYEAIEVDDKNKDRLLKGEVFGKRIKIAEDMKAANKLPENVNIALTKEEFKNTARLVEEIVKEDPTLIIPLIKNNPEFKSDEFREILGENFIAAHAIENYEKGFNYDLGSIVYADEKVFDNNFNNLKGSEFNSKEEFDTYITEEIKNNFGNLPLEKMSFMKKRIKMNLHSIYETNYSGTDVEFNLRDEVDNVIENRIPKTESLNGSKIIKPHALDENVDNFIRFELLNKEKGYSYLFDNIEREGDIYKTPSGRKELGGINEITKFSARSPLSSKYDLETIIDTYDNGNLKIINYDTNTYAFYDTAMGKYYQAEDGGHYTFELPAISDYDEEFKSEVVMERLERINIR